MILTVAAIIVSLITALRHTWATGGSNETSHFVGQWSAAASNEVLLLADVAPTVSDQFYARASSRSVYILGYGPSSFQEAEESETRTGST